ncbi:MAG: peptidoglycan DD-metalloendopeptidase family protein [Myxococcaceae bacterium]|nr:peptidoglycan DD-metalloendopeptidase family protein [Myxococcaceae bacterium]
MKKNRLFLPLGLVLFVVSLAVGFYFSWQRQGLSDEELEAPQEGAFHTPIWTRTTDRLLARETLSQALIRQGLSSQEIQEIVEALKPDVDMKKVRSGDVFVIERPFSLLENWHPFSRFELIQKDSHGVPIRFEVFKSEGLTHFNRHQTPVSQKQAILSGKISNSLYEGILAAGGDAGLVNQFSELFGWQLDFYRDAQRGDTFKLIVESRYADGKWIGYGNLLAAQYNNRGRLFRGFHYQSDDLKHRGFFDEQGQSVEKGFLKAPMALARITSRFGQRFHPVLMRQKKHNGVDYGAPTGTPFWSIADGTVLEARYSPTAGRMVRIRHRGGYVTEYFHASRIAPGIRAGASVKQKQIIGYVGTTGRSTGPHLHFGMMLNKNYIDPGKQRFPAGQPLPNRVLPNYLAKIKPFLQELERS